MADSMPLEAMVSRYLDVAALGERSTWLQAEIAEEASARYGIGAARWASQVGCSATWVRQMRRTLRAFPAEDDRATTLSFSLHVLCAHTEDPAYWLLRAVSEAMSWTDLRQAIRKQHSPALAAEDQRAKGEWLLQRLRRWGEQAPREIRREVASQAREWAVGA